MISDAFIEAVAAIVLQTAIRRFMAIRKVRRLRRGETGRAQSRRQSTPEREPSRKTASPTATNPAVQPVVRRQDEEISSPKQLRFSEETFEEMNEPHPIHEFYDLAAIQIQSVFRGWWVRDSINVDH